MKGAKEKDSDMIESPRATEVHATFLQCSENTFDTADPKIG